MNWFTGVVLFVIIWWTALFAVLPIGTRPVAQADDRSGWRGAPERPRILMKVIVTTIVAIVLWTGSYLLIQSDYISFRHGVFAEPEDLFFIIFKTFCQTAPPRRTEEASSVCRAVGVSSPNLACLPTGRLPSPS